MALPDPALPPPALAPLAHAVAEIAARQSRLLAELRSAAAWLESIVRTQQSALGDAVAAASPQSIHDIRALYDTRVPLVIHQPLAAYHSRLPLQQTLQAFDDYDRTVDRLIDDLPEPLSATGAEWLEAIGPDHFGNVARALLRGRTRVRVPRETLSAGVMRERVGRRTLEGRLMVGLAAASRRLLAPWRAVRRPWLSADEAAQADWQLDAAIAGLDGAVRDVASALQAIELAFAATPRHLARCLGPVRIRQASGLPGLAAHDQVRRRRLGEQARASDAVLEIHRQLAQTHGRLVALVGDVWDARSREHAALLARLDEAIGWLNAGASGDAAILDVDATEITPASSVLGNLTYASQALADELPDAVDVAPRPTPRPWLRRTWRQVRPRQVARQSMERTALPLIGDGLKMIEQRHQGVLVEMTRARDVIRFAREAARADGAANAEIEHEGVANASSLLAYHREQLEGLLPRAEAFFVTGVLRAVAHTSLALDEGQLSVIQQAARGSLPAARVLSRRAGVWIEERATDATRRSGAAYRAALVRLHWLPEPLTIGPHVVFRERLTSMLGAATDFDDLPQIYQHLFRLVPVEDPRFLVGRDQEMAAMADARRQWQQGHDTALIFVGARGSGKTSLINCALKEVLADVPIVRSEFSERLTTAAQLHAFLARLLDVPPDQVERELMAKRRVIILEELERTFLRTVDGFDAARTLLRLIAATSNCTLWVVSINLAGYRLLNAVTRLESRFSHRINAMAVEPTHLREAILMRHNLSGLRMQYKAPPRRSSWVLRVPGQQIDPEEAFFDALARESGGVFRTAFALWQRYADRVDGGVLYMDQPIRSNYGGIADTLAVRELFTLVAILQHGSLTPAEHSRVFNVDVAASRSELDNLLVRELIEPDPGRFGFRVVPDATGLVRDVLFRKNLG